MADQDTQYPYFPIKVLNKQIDTGWNNFIEVIEEIKDWYQTSEISMKKKKTFKMIENFMCFFTQFCPTPSQMWYCLG